MHAPEQSVTLSPAEIEALNAKLSDLRHNVNNCLSLIVAVSELLRSKPEMAARLAESLAEPSRKIGQELRTFSDEFEAVLRLRS